MQIIRVPRPRRLAGDKERAAILKFIFGCRTVVIRLIELRLVTTLGFTNKEAKVAIKTIIRQLTEQKLIKTVTKDGEVVSASVISEGEASLSKPKTRSIKVIKKSSTINSTVVDVIAEPSVSITVPTIATKFFHHWPSKKKGLTRKQRMKQERGDRNEMKLFKIANEMTNTLKDVFPQNIVAADCRRSRKGDEKDIHGIDVTMNIKYKDGESTKEVVIEYDSKSSKRGVRQYESRKGRRYKADLKKAILICDNRNEEEVIMEILDDLSSVLPEKINLGILRARLQ